MAVLDAVANLAVSTVATAPSPATTGTSLVVTAGQGSRFPTAPFNATIWPAGAEPTPANSEIVRVTAVSTDTLTITRTQESTSARTVIVGDRIAATFTKKFRDDIENGFVAAAGDTMTGGLLLTGSGAQLSLAGTTPTTNPPYAMVMDTAGTNLFPNPSLETNTTSFSAVGGTTLTRSNTAGHQWIGAYGLRVQKTTAVTNDGVETAQISGFTAGQVVTLSAYVCGLGGAQTLRLTAVDNATSPVTTNGQQFTAENSWTRYSVSATIGAGGTSIKLQIRTTGALATMDFAVDGVQFEVSPYPTSYMDGDQSGSNSWGLYAWTGTAHASTSTRGAGTSFLNPLSSNVFSISRDGRVFIGRGAEGSNSESGNGLIVNAYSQQTIGEAMGIQIVSYLDGAASNATLAGLDSTAAVKMGNANNHSGPLYGTSGAVVHEGTGTIALAYGIVCGIFNGFKGRGGNGFITTAIAAEVYSPGTDTGGTGTFTNTRGLEVQAQSAGITDNAGILLHMSGLPNGQAAVTQARGLYMPDETVTLGNTTGTLLFAHGIYLGAPTYTASAGTRTITYPATIWVNGNPVAGSNTVFSNGPWGLFMNGAYSYFTGPVANQRDKYWATTTDRQGTFSTTSIGVSSYGHSGWAVTSGTAATLQTNARGAWSRLSTTAVNNNAATVLPNASAFNHTRKDWIPFVTMVVEIPTITLLRVHCGLYSASPSGADSLAALSACGFRFSTGAPDTNWQCITASGAAQTVANSGVAVAANTRYVLQIEVVDGSTVRFWINYQLVATATATLPAAATDLGMALTVTTLSAAQRDLHMNRMQLEQV
jgi:hypothetical protein